MEPKPGLEHIATIAAPKASAAKALGLPLDAGEIPTWQAERTSLKMTDRRAKRCGMTANTEE